MDLAFYSAGNSTMNGLLSVAAKAGNVKLTPKGVDGKSPQFKELLNRSQRDTRDTAQNGVSAQEQQPNNELVQTEPTEKVTASIATVTSESDAGSGDTSVDQSQDNSQKPVVGNDLLSMIQNLQTAMTPVQPDIDLAGNAGAQPGNAIESLVQGLVQNAPTDQNTQTVGSVGQNNLPVLDQNGSPLNFQEIIAQQPVVAGKQNDAQVAQTAEVKGQQSQIMTMSEAAAGIQPPAQNGQPQNTAKQRLGIDEPGGQPVGVSTESQKMAAAAEETVSSDATAVASQAGNVQQNTETVAETVTKTEMGLAKEGLSEQDDSENNGLKSADSMIQPGSPEGVNISKTTPVQTSSKVPLSQQIEQQVLQNYDTSKPVTFTMTLSPENLGDIDVQMKYDQGKLVIDIMAVSKETQKLLGKEVNQLVRSLALQNVQVDSVHVNTPVEQTSGSSSQNSASLMNGGSEFAQQQQQNAQLRESMLRNSRIFKNLQPTSDDDVNVVIPQNLLNNGNYRVNYLI